MLPLSLSYTLPLSLAHTLPLSLSHTDVLSFSLVHFLFPSLNTPSRPLSHTSALTHSLSLLLDINLLLPIMLAILSAKLVGDRITIFLYHIHSGAVACLRGLLAAGWVSVGPRLAADTVSAMN